MEVSWLNYVTALGSVATPILVLIFAGVGWKIRNRLERVMQLEDSLRNDRIVVYNKILEPFIILLTNDSVWAADEKNKRLDRNAYALSKMLTLDYMQQAFKLCLVGSDSVVKSYNNLQQYLYNSGQSTDSNESDINRTKEMMSLLGEFLLQIRKSLGNETTKLESWDMLEWFITDARQYRYA